MYRFWVETITDDSTITTRTFKNHKKISWTHPLSSQSGKCQKILKIINETPPYPIQLWLNLKCQNIYYFISDNSDCIKAIYVKQNDLKKKI